VQDTRPRAVKLPGVLCNLQRIKNLRARRKHAIQVPNPCGIDNPLKPLMGLGLGDEKMSLAANFWNLDATKANKASHSGRGIRYQSGWLGRIG